ncbi:MFS superfamily sulfate permease-like transporter [Streptosporangium becharense]|uniref:MFS superfamily sulfate permease-like transporter n=1 Tax=Streptosporangium becharense TaxID=1816182 RepID=A0A7W9MEK7_9ACTN|nr:SulP family inorganic anion transporter [Streptosporangium becharense]MBB2910638.1 MFS superfamily sulfate permease-like transporter [Streptosporangium becharense]MBB5817333.1 MFS superfamily sulfate permease-like transporter [Streptosporangium becharense]
MALAAALSLLVGVCCLLMAALPLQGVADFLSAPVMLGYLAGVGIEILAGQVSPLLGIPAPVPDPLGKLWYALTHLGQAGTPAATTGLAALATLVVLRRCLPGLPAGLVVCVLGITVSAAVGLAGRGVAVVGPAVGGLPMLAWPGVNVADLWALLLPAAGMALIASVETVSAVRQTGTDIGGRFSLDRETTALGGASLAAGMLSGFPPMASTSRTLSARGAGAQSQLFQLVAAGIVLFVLFTGGPLVALLPIPVLAAVVMMGVPRLIDVTGLLRLWRGWRAESMIALVAVVGVLALGVLRGLLIAVILSAGQLIRRAARPHESLIVVVDDDQPPRDLGEDASPHPDILIYRVDAPLFFANAGRIRQRILTLVTAREPYPRGVILDAEAVFYVDATAADALAQLTADLRALGCRLVLARVHEPVLAVLRANPYHDGATRNLPVFPGVRQAFTAMREP